MEELEELKRLVKENREGLEKLATILNNKDQNQKLDSRMEA